MDAKSLLTAWATQEIEKLEAEAQKKMNDKQITKCYDQAFGLAEVFLLCGADSLFGTGKVIFLDFALLSQFLLQSPLSKAQKTEFILWVIKQNIKNPLISKEMVPIFKIIRKSKSGAIVGIKIKKEMIERQEISPKLEAMQVVYDTAINKMTETEEDIESVGKALAVLEVSPSLIKIMQTSLRKQSNELGDTLKEKIKVSEPQVLSEPIKVISSQANIDRKYRLTRRQIEEYYNLETSKLERIFTLPEILMVAKMMKSIELPDYVIEDFVIKAEHTLILRSTDVIAEYRELHEMLDYYQKSNPELGNYIAQIDDCLLEMAALGEDNKEEKEEWSRMIREDVEAVLKLLPKDGKYVMEVTNGNVNNN